MANNFQEKNKTRWYTSYGLPEKENQQDEKQKQEVKKFEGRKVGKEEEADKYKIYRAVQQAGDSGRR